MFFHNKTNSIPIKPNKTKIASLFLKAVFFYLFICFFGFFFKVVHFPYDVYVNASINLLDCFCLTVRGTNMYRT